MYTTNSYAVLHVAGTTVLRDDIIHHTFITDSATMSGQIDIKPQSKLHTAQNLHVGYRHYMINNLIYHAHTTSRKSRLGGAGTTAVTYKVCTDNRADTAERSLNIIIIRVSVNLTFDRHRHRRRGDGALITGCRLRSSVCLQTALARMVMHSGTSVRLFALYLLNRY